MQWRPSSLSGKWWSDDCQKESGSKRSSSGSMSGEMQNCNKTHGSPLWTLECFLDGKEKTPSESWVCNADVSKRITKWLLARNSQTSVGWQTKCSTLESVSLDWNQSLLSRFSCLCLWGCWNVVTKLVRNYCADVIKAFVSELQ